MLGKYTIMFSRRSSKRPSSVSLSFSAGSEMSSVEKVSEEKLPTPHQLKLAKEELKKYHMINIEELGEGGYGSVYKATYNDPHDIKYRNVPVVIKVSLFKYTHQMLKKVKTIHKLLNKTLEKRNSQKKNKQYAQEKNEQQFYTEDYAFRSKDHPALIYHIMEFLPGDDMHVYFTKYNKGKVNLSFKGLIRIFCSLIHCLGFFHDSGIVFNDLKLENIIVDPEYKRATLIDYIESSTRCSQFHCKDNDGVFKTIINPENNTPSFADDVWRLALTILDGIYLCNKTIKNFDELPANKIMNHIRKYSYSMKKIKEIVDEELGLLQNKMKIKPSDIQHLQGILLIMLDHDATKRPSLNELVTREPFSVCTQNKQFRMPRMSNERRIGKTTCKRLRQQFTRKLTKKSII